MKGRNLILVSALILAIGIVLLLANQAISPLGIVIVGGILFILAGIFNVISYDGARRKADSSSSGHGSVATAFNWFTSAGAVILGLCMLIFQNTFIGLVGVMFGVLIAFMAFYQIYILAIGTRPVVLPSWLYITPVLLAGLAIFLFMQKPIDTDTRTTLVTAIALILFGAMGIVEGSLLGNANRKRIQQSKKPIAPLDESVSEEPVKDENPK